MTLSPFLYSLPSNSKLAEGVGGTNAIFEDIEIRP